MQLLRHADLHCPPLRCPDVDRGESRLAIDDGVLGSAVRRQCNHQALPHGLLSHAYRARTCLFWIGHVSAGVLCRLAGWSGNVLLRGHVDDLPGLAADHQLRWWLARKSTSQ